MFKREIEIPSPEAMREESPLSASLEKGRKERIALIKRVLSGEEDKFLVIVGPCSAHAEAPVLEYVKRLGNLQERVQEKLVLIPRIFTDKPRTKGVGYKGMFSQPDLKAHEDILRGIRAVRRLHLRAIEESGLYAASEMTPGHSEYIEDLTAYAVVGARTSEDPLHRMTASGLSVAVGIKNPMSGSIPALVNSVYAAQHPQTFLYRGWQVTTEGNPYAHTVLRGRVDAEGKDFANFDLSTVKKILEEYDDRAELRHPAAVIDTNHSNSGKRYKEQIRISEEVLKNRDKDEAYRKLVKGLMIESFLEEGCQSCDEIYGKSITDPCLGWADTERLILTIAEKV